LPLTLAAFKQSRTLGPNPRIFGYTYREHYENIDAVSMERKQVCIAYRPPKKAHHPNPLMNAIGQKKHASTALLTGTTRSFLLTWRNKDGLYPITYKRNSMNTSNVADWSMVFYAYNAVLAIMNNWLRSAVPTVGAMRRTTRFLSQLRCQAHVRKCSPVG
jgi:hypothetical protein